MADATSPATVLIALDKLLEERPQRETHDMSEVTRNLTSFRDGVIQRIRAKGNPPASMERLARLNGVLSSLYGVHYPIGKPPWDLLRKARESFGGLAKELQAAGEA